MKRTWSEIDRETARRRLAKWEEEDRLRLAGHSQPRLHQERPRLVPPVLVCEIFPALDKPPSIEAFASAREAWNYATKAWGIIGSFRLLFLDGNFRSGASGGVASNEAWDYAKLTAQRVIEDFDNGQSTSEGK